MRHYPLQLKKQIFLKNQQGLAVAHIDSTRDSAPQRKAIDMLFPEMDFSQENSLREPKNSAPYCRKIDS